MPRPIKKRRICEEPICKGFGPLETAHDQSESVITMTVDEYESMRLIDLEGFSQEQCAERMDVARTTAQHIYNTAHAKLAECIVYGKQLKIIGGNYFVCDGRADCGYCRKNFVKGKANVLRNKEENEMRLAVTYDDGKIFQHFGRTEFFKIFDIEDGKIVNAEVVSTNGQGHGALAGVLGINGVDALVCGGIGPGAQQALVMNGIKLYAGYEGPVDAAAAAYIEGKLEEGGANCDHHDHEGGCGHHDHGEGGCCGGHGHGEGGCCH